MTTLLTIGLFFEYIGILLTTFPVVVNLDDVFQALGYKIEFDYKKRVEEEFKFMNVVRVGLMFLYLGLGLQLLDSA